MQHLLVALDVSDHARRVLAVAAGLAMRLGADLSILHVAAPDPDFVGFDAGPQSVRDVRAREVRAEHRQLEQWASDCRERGMGSRSLLVQGPTTETILAQAEKLGADMLVVGTHSKGKLARSILGSVSETLVKDSPRPVLIVPRTQ